MQMVTRLVKQGQYWTLRIVVIPSKYICTGLRPIYVIFFEFLPISFQMKNNDNMKL